MSCTVAAIRHPASPLLIQPSVHLMRSRFPPDVCAPHVGADTYMHNSSSSSSCDAGLLSDTTSSAATSAASTHLSSKHHHQLQHQQQAALRRRSTADIAAHTAAAAAAAAAVASHTTIGSSKGSSTAAHTTTNMSLKLGSTSQLCKWSQEAYLQDKLRAGAAAVKVGVRSGGLGSIGVFEDLGICKHAAGVFVGGGVGR